MTRRQEALFKSPAFFFCDLLFIKKAHTIMLYRINETDADRTGSVSVSQNTNLATAIDKNRQENPTLQTAVVPSPQEQQKEKNGQVANITVDASQGGARAVQKMNTMMNSNPTIKKAVENGDAQVVMDYGRGTKNVSESVRERMKRELQKFELNENTTMTMDAKSFIEYLKWKNEK